jgi:tetratricopeptide (TPR) repeat protein
VIGRGAIVFAVIAALAVAPPPAGADDDDDLAADSSASPPDYDFSWDAAIEEPNVDYEREMDIGDDYASRIAWGGLGRSTSRQIAERALLAYANAASARPDAPEPHWRASLVLEVILESYSRLPDYRRRLIEEYEAFEKLAPLDPRVDEILFQRAIQHTHLSTDADLEAAVLDYQVLIDRSDPNTNLHNASLWLGNLGETYMMLGRMEEAIDTYHRALDLEIGVSHTFGLAVALDRSGEGAQARQLLASFGEGGIRSFLRSTMGPTPTTFYVPRGEELYYYGMAAEVLGMHALARTCFEGFVTSGAHPVFQPRAEAHIKALAGKKDVQPPDSALPTCGP